jgi:ABC-type multidrug transport system fused ATPase/permease subunit
MALELSGASAATIVVDLSVFAAAGLRLLPAANRSIGLLHTLAFYRADLDEVRAEMSLPVEQLAPRPAASLPPPFQHAVRLEGIEARYVDGTGPVLHDVDLQIASGEKVAVVGGSGSGKSTLLNVLLGFVPASAGRVLFDGIEDRPLARFRRSAVAFVPQTILLLDDTVLANILFGLDAADEERIWKCLHIADFADRVRRMPEGLLARVGEDGVKLSGGERQRLALARALYQQPAFLVLDEATSQIDIRTEHLILERLFAAMPDLTLVMATHRTESAAFFSRRIVIEGGTARNPVPEPARRLS